MTLQQLRYFVAINKHGLNITNAAKQLYTSQPGVSKQLKLLEDELGLCLFSRRGKSISGMTEAGKQVLSLAETVLKDVERIKLTTQQLKQTQAEQIRVGATAINKKYTIPSVAEPFSTRYPEVEVQISEHSTLEPLIEQVAQHQLDFVIANQAPPYIDDLVGIPLYHWDCALILPPDHPLNATEEITADQLLSYPLLIDTTNEHLQQRVCDHFARQRRSANIVVASTDDRLIKDHVRRGTGVGIMPCMAFNPDIDHDLVAKSAYDLLPSETNWLIFNVKQKLAPNIIHLWQMIAPQLTEETIQSAVDRAKYGKSYHQLELSRLPFKLIENRTSKSAII